MKKLFVLILCCASSMLWLRAKACTRLLECPGGISKPTDIPGEWQIRCDLGRAHLSDNNTHIWAYCKPSTGTDAQGWPIIASEYAQTESGLNLNSCSELYLFVDSEGNIVCPGVAFRPRESVPGNWVTRCKNESMSNGQTQLFAQCSTKQPDGSFAYTNTQEKGITLALCGTNDLNVDDDGDFTCGSLRYLPKHYFAPGHAARCQNIELADNNTTIWAVCKKQDGTLAERASLTLTACKDSTVYVNAHGRLWCPSMVH